MHTVEDEEELELKKKARRRLVGAVVLVLLVVTLVPLLIDGEPKKISDDVEINVISESASPSTTQSSKVDQVDAGASRLERESLAVSEGEDSENVEIAEYVVQLGVFSKAATAKGLASKLEDSGFPVIMDTIDGERGSLTRIRVGTFRTKATAQKTLERLERRRLTYGDAQIKKL